MVCRDDGALKAGRRLPALAPPKDSIVYKHEREFFTTLELFPSRGRPFAIARGKGRRLFSFSVTSVPDKYEKGF